MVSTDTRGRLRANVIRIASARAVGFLSMFRLLRPLRDARGAVMIEFALCISAFMALLLAAMQTALVYFAQEGIQTSAEIMARRLLTGEIRQSSTSAAQFKAAACATLPAYMQCSKIIVDARQASTFGAIDTHLPTFTYDSTGRPTNTQYSTGTAGSIVILRLIYPWSVTKGPLGFNLSNQPNGPRLLIGTMIFKSEVYQ